MTLKQVLDQALQDPDISKYFDLSTLRSKNPTDRTIEQHFSERYGDFLPKDRSMLKSEESARLESDQAQCIERVQMWEQVNWIGIPLVLGGLGYSWSNILETPCEVGWKWGVVAISFLGYGLLAHFSRLIYIYTVECRILEMLAGKTVLDFGHRFLDDLKLRRIFPFFAGMPRGWGFTTFIECVYVLSAVAALVLITQQH